MAGRGKRAYSMSAWTMRPYPPSSGIACFILHGAVIFASSQPFLIPIWAMLSLCIHRETLRGMNHVPFLQKFFTCRRFHVKLFTVYKERGRIRWLLQREGRLCFPRLLVNEGCKCHFM